MLPFFVANNLRIFKNIMTFPKSNYDYIKIVYYIVMDHFNEIDEEGFSFLLDGLSQTVEKQDRDVFKHHWNKKEYELFWEEVLKEIDLDTELSGLFRWKEPSHNDAQGIIYRKFPDNPIELSLDVKDAKVKIRAIAKLPAARELDQLVTDTIGDPKRADNEYLAFSIENEKPEEWGFLRAIHEMVIMLKALDENIYPILIEHAIAIL